MHVRACYEMYKIIKNAENETPKDELGTKIHVCVSVHLSVNESCCIATKLHARLQIREPLGAGFLI